MNRKIENRLTTWLNDNCVNPDIEEDSFIKLYPDESLYEMDVYYCLDGDDIDSCLIKIDDVCPDNKSEKKEMYSDKMVIGHKKFSINFNLFTNRFFTNRLFKMLTNYSFENAISTMYYYDKDLKEEKVEIPLITLDMKTAFYKFCYENT